MAAVLDYTSVKHITNQDFASCYRDLLKKCEEMEAKYRAGNLLDCCRDARSINEKILRYMYSRLLHRRDSPTAGDILKNRKFTEKVTDIDLLMAAEEVQRLGNMHAHDNDTAFQNETEAQFQLRKKQEAERLARNTEHILEQFSVALQYEIDFINNKIPGVMGKLNVNFQPAVKGEAGRGENRLEADLTEVPDRGQYKYVWKIQESSGESRIVQNNGRMLILRQWMIGKMIRLEAVNTVTNQVLSKEYGPVRNDEVIIEQRKPIFSFSPALTKNEDIVRRETTPEQKKPNPSVPPAPPKIKDTVRRETASETIRPQPAKIPTSDESSDVTVLRSEYFRCRKQVDELKKKTALLRAERERVCSDPNATYEQKMAALQDEDNAYTAQLDKIAEMRHYAEKLHSMAEA